MSKIILKKSKPHPFPPYDRDSIQWKASLPFFVNSRGMLIHRVRSVRSFYTQGRQHRHDSVHYFCGAFCITHENGFTADPPKDRLLCARCEALAVRHGQPSATALTSRHVCVGEIRAHRLCCMGTEN